MKILHLIDSLDYTGSARQICLLGPAFAARDVAVEVCSLGPSRPWTDSLCDAGIRVHVLGWTRWFDPSVLWNLRAIVRGFCPDLIHVWRLPALRALATVRRDCLPRVVMSAPLPPQGKLAWWDRRLLQQVRCLTVAGVSEQERCLHQGLVPPLRVVPPAVGADDAAPSMAPKSGRTILCIGKLERAEGLRQAIWAFDILRNRFPESRLQLVGTGSQASGMRALTRGLASSQRVEFLAERTDIAPLLREAEIVWVPSEANCGRQVALEAMAHGRPVVAADVPCLRDVIADGETGYLTPRGDVVALCRRTFALFQDAALRERIGLAGQRHVAQRFAMSEAVERWQEIYKRVAG